MHIKHRVHKQWPFWRARNHMVHEVSTEKYSSTIEWVSSIWSVLSSKFSRFRIPRNSEKVRLSKGSADAEGFRVFYLTRRAHKQNSFRRARNHRVHEVSTDMYLSTIEGLSSIWIDLTSQLSRNGKPWGHCNDECLGRNAQTWKIFVYRTSHTEFTSNAHFDERAIRGFIRRYTRCVIMYDWRIIVRLAPVST